MKLLVSSSVEAALRSCRERRFRSYDLRASERTDLQHLLSLHPLVAHEHSGPSAALVVPDALGHLRGFQLLETVALGAAPLEDLLLR